MHRLSALFLLSLVLAVCLHVGTLSHWASTAIFAAPTFVASQPTLTIDNSQSVQTGNSVTVPISFETGPDGIASVVFSLDIDQTCLAFDATDGDSNGMPDAIVSYLPPEFIPQVAYNANDSDGELDFVIVDYTLPFAALPDLDPMITIEFTATCTPAGSSQIAPLAFSTSPAASFGDQTGQSIAGSTIDGFVTILPASATITIIEDSSPNSNVNFRFDGQLGTFRLDDPDVDDGDAFPQSQPFTVPPGSYRIRQQEFTAWVLTSITCTPTNTAPTLKLENELLILTVAAGETVSCTFVNQRAAEINARKGNDLNGNGGFNPGEPWLPDWTIELYNSVDALVGSQVTDADGRVNFKVAPGSYTVCEVEQNGWTNTKPGSQNVNFAKPCFDITVAAGQAAWARFFNTQLANTAIAATNRDDGIIYTLLPDADEAGNYTETPLDLWAEEETEVHIILLPSILK